MLENKRKALVVRRSSKRNLKDNQINNWRKTNPKVKKKES